MMMKKLAKVSSEKDVANSLFISPSTVHRYLKEVSSSVKTTPNSELPKHLSFDEFKSTKDVDGAMSFIYCDSITHDIIDILPDRRQFKLKEYFLRFSRKQRKNVKSISIDMYVPYISLIESLFPEAKIIIDRFHIVQAITREINRTRIKVMNEFRRKDRPNYNKLKRYWKLLLKTPHDLNRMHYHQFRLFTTWQSQYSLVQYLLSLDDQLKATYEMGHLILDVLKSNNIKPLTYSLYTSKTITYPKV